MQEDRKRQSKEYPHYKILTTGIDYSASIQNDLKKEISFIKDNFKDLKNLIKNNQKEENLISDQVLPLIPR